MRANINEELCTGCGLCVDVCPDVFEMKDDKAIVKGAEIPDNAVDCSNEAAGNCPVEAISVA